MVGRQGLHHDVLLRLLREAGAENASTHLATGNVLFDEPPDQLVQVVQRLEAGIERVVGRRRPVIVREAPWLSAFMAAEPFRAFPDEEWERAVVFLVREAAPLDPAGLVDVDGLRVVDVRPHELLTAGRRGTPGPGPLRLLAPTRREEATSRSWGTIERLARLA